MKRKKKNESWNPEFHDQCISRVQECHSFRCKFDWRKKYLILPGEEMPKFPFGIPFCCPAANASRPVKGPAKLDGPPEIK